MSSSGRRALVVLGVAAAVVGLVSFLGPDAALSTARSPRALGLLLLLVIVTTVGGRLVSRRWGGLAGHLARAAVLGAVGLLVLAPALRQTELDEELPGATRVATTSPPSTAETASAESASAPVEEPTAPVPAASPAPVAAAPVPATAPEPETAPVRLTTGSLRGIGHQASGSVSVFRLADGSAIARFEDVDIKGSPDPVLYLVPGPDQETRDGGTEVADLRATRGTFNHVLPSSFALDRPFTVFIWCDQFATPIAAAGQRAA